MLPTTSNKLDRNICIYIYNNLFPTKLGKGQKQTKKKGGNK